MMTPQQAFRVFCYADWAMGLVGVVAFCMSIGWAIAAILPRFRGRRGRVLLRALMCLLVSAMFWGIQASLLIAWFNEQWTLLRLALFALPAVFMLFGLIGSVAYGVRAVLRQSGEQRRRAVLRSFLGILVFGVGIAPHTVTTLIKSALIISAEDHTNGPGTLTHIGEPVPDFRLTSIEGTPFRTVDLRGKVIILNFFATWCGACRMELPHLQAIWNEFRSDDDFRMLVVAGGESDDTVKAFQQEHGFTFPLASDLNKAVYKEFASQYIPRTYLISRQGTIAYQFHGGYEEEIPKLRKLLSRELAKKD